MHTVMGEVDTIWGVWRGPVAVITRYPLATFVPAAVVGIIGEVPAYLIVGRTWLNLVLTIAGAYFAYNLYLVYAEGIVYGAENGEHFARDCGVWTRSCSGRCPTSCASSWPG